MSKSEIQATGGIFAAPPGARTVLQSDSPHGCYPPKNIASGGGFGPAIEYCSEDEHGHFTVGNGEYGSYVNFCPYCGAKAPKGIPLK